jgi:hypothetical protein
MPLNRFGFHNLGTRLDNGAQSDVVQQAGRQQPTVALVQDSDNLAARILEVAPHCLVIQKRWRPDESTCWQWQSPADFVAQATSWGAMDKRVLVYALNEPAAFGEDITTLCNWLIAVGRECTRLGYRAVLGNIGPAIYPPDVIESGRFDNYLRYLHEESLKPDGHFAGWHEYTFAFLPFGAGEYVTDELRNPAALQPPWRNVTSLSALAKWSYQAMKLAAPTGPDIRWPYPYEDKEHRPYANWWLHEGDFAESHAQILYPRWWHLLRSQWFELYAASKGIGKHKKLITEFGWDDMPDLAPTGIRQYLSDAYGIPNNDKGVPYKGLRGGRTLRNVWEAWWPGWTFEEAVMQQLLWAETNYPADYIGFCLFTISQNTEWSDDWGFNWLPERALLERMATYTPPEPPPDEPPEDDEPPLSHDLTLLVTGIFLGILVLVYFITHHLAIGAQLMTPDPNLVDLYNVLANIPIFAAVAFGLPVVYYLLEVWKRLIDPKVPEYDNPVLRFFLKPSPAALFLVLVMVLTASYYFVGTLGQGETFQQIAKFIVDLINAVGQYLFPTLIGQVVGSRVYDHLRAKQTVGFNAPAVKRTK